MPNYVQYIVTVVDKKKCAIIFNCCEYIYMQYLVTIVNKKMYNLETVVNTKYVQYLETVVHLTPAGRTEISNCWLKY